MLFDCQTISSPNIKLVSIKFLLISRASPKTIPKSFALISANDSKALRSLFFDSARDKARMQTLSNVFILEEKPRFWLKIIFWSQVTDKKLWVKKSKNDFALTELMVDKRIYFTYDKKSFISLIDFLFITISWNRFAPKIPWNELISQ